MSFRNPLGSVTALSLAADPAVLIPAATVAGVAVTVAAAVFVYKEYKDYQEKKHREAIEEIIRLYNRHLARIYIPDYNEIQGFPAIFKLDPSKDSSTVESMHLTDEDIHAMGKTLPHGTDIVLSMYREHVLNAILKLKEYYFSRKERKDITAGVICYLLYILQTKCLNFEGYDYDIAYLNAISNFVTAFASLSNRENSQRFSRLNPVFSYLTSAKQALEKHKETLSLEEMVGELRDSCIHRSNQLIRCMTRLITKNRRWPLIDTVAMDELAQGMLRREYIDKEIKGLVLSKDRKKELADSLFKSWLVGLADYYIQALNPDSKLKREDILVPSKAFFIPDFKRLSALKEKGKKLTEEESAELDEIEATIKSIQKTFEECPNFVTTTLDLKSRNKLPKMIPVTGAADILARSTVIANFATLIHQIISLQYLCSYLMKSTKQLGEIYVKNPGHFCRIFFVLEQLCNQIKDSVTKNKKDLMLVQRSDLNTMQLEAQELLPTQMKELLETSYATISRLGAQVKDYRNRVAKGLNASEPTAKSVKLEMFEVAAVIADIYSIDANAKSAQLNGNKPLRRKHKKHIHRSSQSSHAASESLSGYDSAHSEAAAAEKEIIEEIVMVPKKPIAAVLQPSEKIDGVSSAPVKLVQPIPENKLTTLLSEIRSAVTDIETGEVPSHQTVYDTVISTLTQLERKAQTLIIEKNKTQDRQKKVDNIVELLQRVFTATRDYLKLPHDSRQKQADQFMQTITSELNNEAQSKFIDDHYNRASKAMYTICKFGIFRTDSRQKLAAFQQACSAMTNLYSVPNDIHRSAQAPMAS